MPCKPRKYGTNGFLLTYKGPFFPASRSNAITYEYFCLRGGLENGRNYAIRHRDGTISYHDISVL